MRQITFFMLLIVSGFGALAQTETPTPEPPTPTPEPYVYATMAPVSTDDAGQMTRFDYTATAGDVQIANLLTLILFSLWAMFLFLVLGKFPTGRK